MFNVCVLAAVYLCKGIALCDPVHCSKHTHVHAEVEIFPVVKFSVLVFGQSLTFDEFPLRNSGVFHGRLSHAHAVVLQVIINYYRTNADALIRGVQHILTEVTVETQHLEVRG